jgi:hypothetical protein
MKNSKSIYSLLGLLAIAMAAQSCTETVIEKVETKVDEVKKDTNEIVRDTQKDLRDATGNSSVTKDVGDQVKNAKDEVEFQAKKLKRKVD